MEPTNREFSAGFKELAQQQGLQPPNNPPMESGLDGPYWSQLFGSSQQTLDPNYMHGHHHDTIVIDEPTWEVFIERLKIIKINK